MANFTNKIKLVWADFTTWIKTTWSKTMNIFTTAKYKEAVSELNFSGRLKPEEITTDMKNYVFEKGIYKNVKLLDNSLPFAKLHTSDKEWLKYLFVVLVGTLNSLLVLFFIKNTGLYSFGLSSLFQGIARIIQTSMGLSGVNAETVVIVYNVLFWGLYFMFNIPLIIFSWLKIGKGFTKFTATFLVFSTIVGLGLDYIPGISNIYLFGNTSLLAGTDKNAIYDPIAALIANNQQILPFSVPSTMMANYNMENYIKTFYLFLYGMIYGVIAGVLYAVVYIVGGSTAGMDVVSVYYAIKKQKNIGFILLELNILTMFIGSMIGTYGSAIMIDPVFANFQFILSANFVFTILSLVAFTIVFNKMYPKSKLVDVNIITEKYQEINEALIKVKYTHTTSLHKIIGGYSKLEKVALSSICMQIEVPALIKFVRTFDPKAIITVNPVVAYDGIMKIQQQRSK